jgi:hypothetical protein
MYFMLSVGDRVRTRPKRADGHTRLPGYLAQREGAVVAALGHFRFSDEGAERGAAATRQALYTIEFDAGGHRIRADLFESYLERME